VNRLEITFPREKLTGFGAPELVWLLNRLFVQLLVLLQAIEMGFRVRMLTEGQLSVGLSRLKHFCLELFGGGLGMRGVTPLCRGRGSLGKQIAAAATHGLVHDAIEKQTHSKKALGTWNVSTSWASATTGFAGFTSPSDMLSSRGTMCLGVAEGFGARAELAGLLLDGSFGGAKEAFGLQTE
jgi:hypothetical protein